MKRRSFATLAFKGLRPAQMIEFCRSVIASLTKNPDFPDPVPTLEELTASVNTLEALTIKAATGGFADRQERNAQRLVVDGLFTRVVGYCNNIADGDRAMLAGTGLLLNREPQSRVMTPPEGVTVSYTTQSGELLVRWNRPEAASSFILQYSTDPNAPDNDWVSVPTSRSQHVITGVTPGSIYHVRVLALGPRNQALYSEVVSRMAV